EMQRRKMTMPLLIGGATTSRQHTAVKVAPAYSGPVVHVLDASRAVATVSSLLAPDQREGFLATNVEEQGKLRALHARGPIKPLTPYTEANANRPSLGYEAIAEPPFVGRRAIEVPLDELVPYIDWTFFFTAWQLKGRYPDILEHPKYGEAA